MPLGLLPDGFAPEGGLEDPFVGEVRTEDLQAERHVVVAESDGERRRRDAEETGRRIHAGVSCGGDIGSRAGGGGTNEDVAVAEEFGDEGFGFELMGDGFLVFLFGSVESFFDEAGDPGEDMGAFLGEAFLVIASGFGGHDAAVHADDIAEAGEERDVENRRTRGAEDFGDFAHTCVIDRIGEGFELFAEESQARGCDEECVDPGDGIAADRGVEGAADDGEIADRTGHGTGVVHRRGERDDPFKFDDAEGGFESGDAAVSGRASDGASGLRTHRGDAHAGGDGGGGSAGGASGGACDIPGIAGDGGIETGELRGDGFSEEDGPGSAEAGDDGRILVGDLGFPGGESGGGGESFPVVEVLDAERDAVERSAEFALRAFGIEPAGLCEGLLTLEGDPGVDFRFPAVDLLERMIQDFDAGGFSLNETAVQAADGFRFLRDQMQIGGHGEALGEVKTSDAAAVPL